MRDIWSLADQEINEADIQIRQIMKTFFKNLFPTVKMITPCSSAPHACLLMCTPGVENCNHSVFLIGMNFPSAAFPLSLSTV